MNVKKEVHVECVYVCVECNGFVCICPVLYVNVINISFDRWERSADTRRLYVVRRTNTFPHVRVEGEAECTVISSSTHACWR